MYDRRSKLEQAEERNAHQTELRDETPLMKLHHPKGYQPDLGERINPETARRALAYPRLVEALKAGCEAEEPGWDGDPPSWLRSALLRFAGTVLCM